MADTTNDLIAEIRAVQSWLVTVHLSSVARTLDAAVTAVAERDALQAKLDAAEAEYPGDEYLDAKPHKGADVAKCMHAILDGKETQ